MTDSARSVWLVAAVSICACRGGEIAEPGGDPDIAEFRQGDVVVGRVIYSCLEWRLEGLSPSAGLVIDVFAGPSGPAASQMLSEAQLDTLRAIGLDVLDTFSVPGARVRVSNAVMDRLITGQDPQLFGVFARHVSHARAVPSLERSDVRVIVGYGEDGASSARSAFSAAGGVVVTDLSFVDAFAGVLPDHEIPAFRDRADVEYVELDGVGCHT